MSLIMSESVSINNTLVDALTHYAVSDTTNSSAWKHLADAVMAMVEDSWTYETIAGELKIAEQRYKSEYTTDSLPTAWRSAKSVALKAVRAGVGLKAGGNVVGKSAVERAIKELKAPKDEEATPALVDPFEELKLAFITFLQLYETCRIRVPASELQAYGEQCYRDLLRINA